jgi:putative glycosyltransferase (TIGR04372 family)
MPTRYPTDLADDQWARVAAGPLAGAPGLGPLRAVVDGLRFREAARCPWAVLPPDLPPADLLRTHHRTWAADGTWGRIAAAAAAPVKVAPPKPPSLRRTLARALGRLPGGRTVLRPAYSAVQLAQHLRSRSTPAARLPTTFAGGVAALARGEATAADAHFTVVLGYDPDNAEALLNRGTARRHLDRLPDALADQLAALTLAAGPRLRARVSHQLAEVYTLASDLDRAVGHAYLARLVERFSDVAPWDQDELAEEPDEFELLSEAHNAVAEYLINFTNDFTAAAAVYARRDELRQRYVGWLAAVPGHTRYLSADWVRNIGHMPMVDAVAKMQRLGWFPETRVVLHAPPAETANRAYAGYLKSVVKVVEDPAPHGATRHLANALGSRVASLVDLPSGDRRYLLEAIGDVQEEWERQGRGPLLRLTPADAAAGRDALRRFGVPDGAWFVSLHVRSPGFHREGTLTHSVHRNADVGAYLPAVREVVRRGGWVVRLGDPSMPPLPPLPGVVDYAHSPAKSAQLDVFFCAACRFFVGVASGLCHVPTTFGVPCLLTNWISNALPVYSRSDLFIPKRVWSEAAGRVLTFAEWLAPAHRNRYVLGSAMAEGGLRAVDNTADELLEAVIEMFDRPPAGPDDDRRQAAFTTLARSHGLSGFPRVGTGFLRRHAALLPDAPKPR